MIYTDSEFAALLCNGDKKVEKLFQEIYLDDLIQVSKKKLHKPFEDEKIEIIHDRKRKKKYKVTNDVMKAYVWLVDQMKKKSCKYKGPQPFEHFVRAVMWKRNTTIDYIRHIKGNINNIPKCIVEKGPLYEEITRMKLMEKNRHEIVDELKIDTLEYDEIIDDEDVRKCLHRKDKLIDNLPKKIGEFDHRRKEKSLIYTNKDGEEVEEDLADDTFSPEKELNINQTREDVNKTIKSIFNKDELSLLRIVFDYQMSTDKILEYIASGKLLILERLKIKSSKIDFDKFVEKCINKFQKEFYKIEYKEYDPATRKHVKKKKYSDLDKKTIRYYFDEHFVEFYTS